MSANAPVTAYNNALHINLVRAPAYEAPPAQPGVPGGWGGSGSTGASVGVCGQVFGMGVVMALA